ncbi:MAG: hypothetical protein E6J16_12995 [Chloroflexota bacterium]|nr:MAG: hypothetical protein E6J16_12995 [Chloroflexota bacterium]
MPSDRELVISAVLDAPRQLVFEATTKPEHVKHWWGPWRSTVTLCAGTTRLHRGLGGYARTRLSRDGHPGREGR